MRKIMMMSTVLLLSVILSACIFSEEPNIVAIDEEDLEMTLYSLEKVEENGQAYYVIEAEIENRLEEQIAVAVSNLKTDETVVNDTVFFEDKVKAEEKKEVTMKAKVQAESELEESLDFVVEVQGLGDKGHEKKHKVRIAY